MGVGSLQLVVQAPIDGKRSGVSAAGWRYRARKCGWRWTNHLLTTKIGIGGWKCGEGSHSRGATYILRTSGVHKLRGQAERPLTVEAIYNSFAEVIEVKTVAAPDRTFSSASE